MKTLIIAGLSLSLIGCAPSKIAMGTVAATTTTIATVSNIATYPIRLLDTTVSAVQHKDDGMFDFQDGLCNVAVPLIQPFYSIGAYIDVLDGEINFYTPAYESYVPVVGLSEYYQNSIYDPNFSVFND